MDEQAMVKLIPGTVESDAEGVKMGLDAARALVMGGEPEEALRLVRRAADAAEQAGDDMRSITLARAAADMANEIERVKKGADASGDEAPSSKKLPSPPSRKSVPTPSSKSSPQAAPPPEAALDAPAPSAAPQADAPSDPVEPAERPAPAPKKLEPRPAPAAASAAAPPGMSELLSQGRAVRVLVKRSARDESLYIVRPHSTAHVPVGAREAFLVLGDADPDFLAGATR